MALLAGCATAPSKLHCPAITEIPAAVQRQAASEMAAPPDKPALVRVLDAVAVDRARWRAECGGR
jgi:hypothetical protein